MLTHESRQPTPWLIFDVSQEMKNPFASFFSRSKEAHQEVPLEEGQCWSYDARAGEERSYLVIRKLELLPKIGAVAHISLFGLRIPNARAAGGYSTEAGHLPIALPNLRTSLKVPLKIQVPASEWQDGYRMWREAYDSGSGGVFAKSVRECVAFIEEAFHHAPEG